MKNYLKGAYDLHIHTAPDVIARKCDDKEIVRRIADAGMAGCALKSHYFETAARTKLLAREFPQLRIVGCLALNRSVGGINPQAVLRFAQMGGKMLWFPTMDAWAFQAYKQQAQEEKHLEGLLKCCGEDGQLLPETVEVLQMAAQYRLVVGTGHLDADEALMLVRKGRELGVESMVLTHAEHPALRFTDRHFEEAVALGAYVEHSYNNAWFGRCTIEEIASQIRLTGCEHVILTSDFGQPQAPFADEGMQEYAQALSSLGFSDQQLHQMMCENPVRLLGENVY